MFSQDPLRLWALWLVCVERLNQRWKAEPGIEFAIRVGMVLSSGKNEGAGHPAAFLLSKQKEA
jgi:hypothetical protein